MKQIAPKGVVILNDKMIYVVGIGTIDAEVYNIFLQVDYISPQRYSRRTRVLYSVLGQFIRRPWIHNCHRLWKHQLVDDQQEEVLSDTNLTIYILYLFVSSQSIGKCDLLELWLPLISHNSFEKIKVMMQRNL
ncbi:hypothetical protein T4B_5756 [Trichinella pseudospiralis]|uniref:Uncharacterized protein n=1 Tax=Trichinella pseudospiralis TaxID=6337 RepID=A0A0V1K226_TRIPS|nr:hypothetical protein T4A_2792 [Trichinella pseudospiralis]KRZ33466.1 hypothetical protein T4B_5756 [Trichinella pseudospiralis]KRZ41263.1 hypothetical protein T4C_7695 [Trichinella pseudospiralis]